MLSRRLLHRCYLLHTSPRAADDIYRAPHSDNPRAVTLTGEGSASDTCNRTAEILPSAGGLKNGRGQVWRRSVLF